FWIGRPRFQSRYDPSLEGLRDLQCEAWIEDQIRYHDNTSKRHYRRHHRLARASYAFFGLTICAAVLHAVHVDPHLLRDVFALMVIVLPATAASMAAIRTHRDYLRNSMRSAEMVSHLKELKDHMMRTRDRESFRELVKETEETMLHENEDWRVVVRFHMPEVPA
ncbi:unnamed protein product, partial [marine sediment metagenome]